MYNNYIVLLRVWDQTAVALAGYLGHAKYKTHANECFCSDQYEQQMAGVNSVTTTHADGAVDATRQPQIL